MYLSDLYRAGPVVWQSLPMAPPIFLDLDGVAADFYRRARQLLKREYRDTPSALAWGRLSMVPRLFAELEPLPGALELVEALAHHGPRFQVLTARPLPTGFLVTAERDKKLWVRRKLSPNLKVNVILGGVNKYKYVTPGAVLIDDQERNLKPWREAGGVGIHHVAVEQTLAELRHLGLCA